MTHPEPYIFHKPLWVIWSYLELCRMVCPLREWYLPSIDLSPSRTHYLLAKKMRGLSVTYSGYWHPPLPDIIPPQSQTQNLHSVPNHPKRSYYHKTPNNFNIIPAKEDGVIFLKKWWKREKEIPSSIPKRVAKYGVQIKRPNSIQVWVHFLPLPWTFYFP